MQRNSRAHYFQDYRHKNNSWTLHVTSYKEPEVISTGGENWLSDWFSNWWGTNCTYTTKYGEIYYKDGGGCNENHKAEIVGCMTSLNGVFGAFGAGSAHVFGLGCWSDFAGGLADIMKPHIKLYPKIGLYIDRIISALIGSKEVEPTPCKTGKSEKEFDVEYGEGRYSNWKRTETIIGRRYVDETQDSTLLISHKGDSLLMTAYPESGWRKSGRHVTKLSDKK